MAQLNVGGGATTGDVVEVDGNKLAEAGKGRSMMQELTPEERSFVRKQQLFAALNQFAWAIQRPASDQQYISLCGGDTGLYARHYGMVQAMNNAFNMFGSPIVGALSDRFGRRYLLAAGRCGWVLWFAAIPRFTSLRQRMLGELVCWSLLGSGNWTVYGAQNTDLFGDRPTLSARLAATEQVIKHYIVMITTRTTHSESHS